jgi:chromosome partitioning protein
MRIRRRDKDPADTAVPGSPVVGPYDYDQEGSRIEDPETSLITEAGGDSGETEGSPPASVTAPPASEAHTTPEQTELDHNASAAPPTSAEPQAAPSEAPAPPAVEPVTAQAGNVAHDVTPSTEEAAPVAPETTPTEPGAAKPARAQSPSSAPKHAMRAPSIGDEATELLNGSKPDPRELPRIIAIANQKGGVGKTTTTVNLGAALAELDYRVLVIDLDPQGNATTGLGVEARNFEHSMYDVIMRDLPLEDAIEPTSVKNLFVAPATIDLAGVEIELVPAFSRELKLKRAIDTVVDDFDFVIIDCPPSLGLITVNGLAAADEVLVPIQCEYYALEGLSQLLRNVNLVSTNLNQTLEVSTIVLTMYDARTRLSVDVANEVREHFSERVCRSVIPRTVRLSEAPSFGQPITVFDPTSRGAVAYRELAKEVSNGAPQRSR